MNYSLTIGWMYPDLMSIYGDRGNIICLKKRCEWRNIAIEVKNITLDSPNLDLEKCDILFMGGAQDRQQSIVAKDLKEKKRTLEELIDKGIPGLYICGGYQFLGKYYKEADGTVIEQLGILDVYTEHPGENTKRLIGNIAVDCSDFFGKKTIIVGFENHGGRTILGKEIKPFGKVVVGYGSNEKEGLEGAIYKNSIGSYLHGPILPKNPELSDWFIIKALEVKYKKQINLKELDDNLSYKARQAILKRLKY